MAGVLGQTVAAPERYAPEVLEPISRLQSAAAACFGWDIWHAYELSWCIGDQACHWVGWLSIPADSPATVESKSLKLYLNSLNFYSFADHHQAVNTICADISACAGATVTLECLPVEGLSDITEELDGVNLPACAAYQGIERISPDLLTQTR